MILKNRLKQLRKEENLSQKYFHKEILVSELKIDVTLRTLQNWEANTHDIKAEYANKIANYFNVPVSYLLGYSDKTNENPKETTERILLNSNTSSQRDIDYGKQEFYSLAGNNKIEEEILKKFELLAKTNSDIINPQKWADKWLNDFFAGFGVLPPPVQVILARYFYIEEEKRVPIDILLDSLSDHSIKEPDKMLETVKGIIEIQQKEN